MEITLMDELVMKTQNYWVSGLSVSSGILMLENTFQKLDPFIFSGDGRKKPTLLGPL
jgi:hypothetical protein